MTDPIDTSELRLRSKGQPETTEEKVSTSIEASDEGDRRPSVLSAAETNKLAGEEVVETDADLEPHDDPELRDIPPQVLRVVSLHDDPTLPTITFRYFLLSILFVAPGAFLSQINSFRTTYAPYSVCGFNSRSMVVLKLMLISDA